MKAMYDFDFFVIGAGSGGVRAARMAAGMGVKVAVAEGAPLGGTCVNLGCIPKKLYSYASAYPAHFSAAEGFGWSAVTSQLDWATLKSRRAQEISRLNAVYAQLLNNTGVTVLSGFAHLADPHTVCVGERCYTAKHILIATGGTPVRPTIEGAEWVVTSNDIFDLPTFPQRLLVVGGGYIASEFASIFNGLGAQVTQLYRGEHILRGFDNDLRQFLTQEMVQQGVTIRTLVDITRIEKTAEGLLAYLSDGTVLVADQILYAIGRRPNIDALGLAPLGVQINAKGQIQVNDAFQTTVPSIYALGDVVGRLELTPVALGEAMALVDQLFAQGTKRMDYQYIPTAIFTTPNAATVGLSEEKARALYGDDVQIFRSTFRPLKHTLSGKPDRTLMKMVVQPSTDKVLGLHMVGDDAGEIMQGFAVALKAGASKTIFDNTIGIHPTAAEEFVTMRTPVAS